MTERPKAALSDLAEEFALRAPQIGARYEGGSSYRTIPAESSDGPSFEDAEHDSIDSAGNDVAEEQPKGGFLTWR